MQGCAFSAPLRHGSARFWRLNIHADDGMVSIGMDRGRPSGWTGGSHADGGYADTMMSFALSYLVFFFGGRKSIPAMTAFRSNSPSRMTFFNLADTSRRKCDIISSVKRGMTDFQITDTDINNLFALSAFGESDNPETFFAGKPYVEGLGHAFLMRNYRASLAKWQTADPLGYPDGWNALAYCNNGVTSAVDLWGCELQVVDRKTKPAPSVWHDMGWHEDDNHGTDSPCPCHWWKIDEYEYKVVVMQDFQKKRRWEVIDGLEDWLKGTGMGLEIAGDYMIWTGITTFPGAGVTFAGLCFHTVGELLDYFNAWTDDFSFIHNYLWAFFYFQLVFEIQLI